MNKYLVDTSIFVDYFRQKPSAKIFLDTNNCAISVVSKAELIHGVRNKQELEILVNFCNSLFCFPINEKISNEAIFLVEKYFHSNGLYFLDALIGATAIDEDLTLITGNVKHFSFIPNLKLKDWKSI